MSNEISLNFRLQLQNGLVTDFGPGFGAQRINQTNAMIWKRTIALAAGVDTDVTALITGLTSNGLLYAFNLDPTNYVQWGGGTSAIAVVGQLLPAPVVNGSPVPDAPAFFRLDPTSGKFRMKANTGNCEVLVCVYDL